MMTSMRGFRGAAAVAVVVFLAGCGADTGETPGLDIGADDIGGVVTGPDGPEAGVWVIAETTELGTPMARIVVTDDAGRYLVPDLPDASYDVWVRGYGLVDSARVQASPGDSLDLTATVAPDDAAAAHYYPAGYWYSLIEPPAESEFPGTGPEGNGISPGMENQAEWLRAMKSGGCWACHQLGNQATREIPEALGEFDSSVEAWARRILSGQAGNNMAGGLRNMGEQRALEMFADWTDRIAAGELPPAPPRPSGVERNVVVTVWDWADPTAYLHDVVSTDRRDPTVNAGGPVYGALELSADYVPVLDPAAHTTAEIPLTVRDPETPMTNQNVPASSPYFGDEPIWDSRNNVHNPMIDGEGRVWLTTAVRPPETPAVCREGSDHPSAQLFPVVRAGRHLGVYDPATDELTHIGTCFGTHHLMFAEDEDSTLWTSGGGQVVGWLNTRMFDETGDEEASQGWTALIMDTNGNGQRDDYVEPNEDVDPNLDKRFGGAFYAVAPAPDGSIWGTSLGFPGAVIRLDPGSNPPATALAEVYELPYGNPAAEVQGFSPRGGDVDRNGVIWTALGGSGHLASFDRTRCAVLNGPTATGQHCREGWTLYPTPGPTFKGFEGSANADYHYYNWVDQFDTLGLGANTPIATGTTSDALLALDPDSGEWVIMRVPYPLGFYSRGLDGRIDDPDAGWKGRGVWSSFNTGSPFHLEGGKGATSEIVRFQIRPHPLAN